VSVVIRSTLFQLESGVAARLLGTVRAVVLGGAAPLADVAIVAARVPQLRQLRSLG